MTIVLNVSNLFRNSEAKRNISNHWRRLTPLTKHLNITNTSTSIDTKFYKNSKAIKDGTQLFEDHSDYLKNTIYGII